MRVKQGIVKNDLDNPLFRNERLKTMAKNKVMTEKGYEILQNLSDIGHGESGIHSDRVDVPVWTFSVTQGMGRAAGGTIAGLSHMGAVTIGKVNGVKTIAITATGLDILSKRNTVEAEAATVEAE